MCVGDEAKSSESLSDEQLLHIGEPQHLSVLADKRTAEEIRRNQEFYFSLVQDLDEFR